MRLRKFTVFALCACAIYSLEHVDAAKTSGQKGSKDGGYKEYAPCMSDDWDYFLAVKCCPALRGLLTEETFKILKKCNESSSVSRTSNGVTHKCFTGKMAECFFKKGGFIKNGVLDKKIKKSFESNDPDISFALEEAKLDCVTSTYLTGIPVKDGMAAARRWLDCLYRRVFYGCQPQCDSAHTCTEYLSLKDDCEVHKGELINYPKPYMMVV